MKIRTITQTSVSGIALAKEEINTLKEAQKILNKLWDELEQVDTIEGNFSNIHSIIEGIGDDLDYIATSVDIEENIPTFY